MVHYEGQLEDGTVFDTTVEREPVRFQLGKGQVIRGLERLVLGLRPGEAASAELPPEAAYGQRREELLVTMPAERAPAGLEEGMSVTLQNGRGQDVPAQVVAVADDGTVTCDTNHALAGRTLSFRVELLDIEELLAPAVLTEGLELATFAAGSFWSLELAFQRVPGVAQTSVGYSQGRAERPSFEDVASGRTGHVQATSARWRRRFLERAACACMAAVQRAGATWASMPRPETLVGKTAGPCTGVGSTTIARLLPHTFGSRNTDTSATWSEGAEVGDLRVRRRAAPTRYGHMAEQSTVKGVHRCWGN